MKYKFIRNVVLDKVVSYGYIQQQHRCNNKSAFKNLNCCKFKYIFIITIYTYG